MMQIDWKSRFVKQKFYHTKQWKQIRLFILARDPICKVCGKKASIQVDHIIDISKRPDLRLDTKNLQGLCIECHSAKTKREMNETYKTTPGQIMVFKNNYTDW